MALFDDIKDYLDITWDDAATDRKLAGIIESGKAYLCRKAGRALPFDGPGADLDAVALLKDYARYARSNAADEFEGNYIHEVAALHDKYAVMGADAGAGGGADGGGDGSDAGAAAAGGGGDDTV